MHIQKLQIASDMWEPLSSPYYPPPLPPLSLYHSVQANSRHVNACGQDIDSHLLLLIVFTAMR
jgi:hypothetical protein